MRALCAKFKPIRLYSLSLTMVKLISSTVMEGIGTILVSTIPKYDTKVKLDIMLTMDVSIVLTIFLIEMHV